MKFFAEFSSYPSYQTCHPVVSSRCAAGRSRGPRPGLHDEGCLDLQEIFLDGSLAPAKQGSDGVGTTNRGKGSKIMAIADRRRRPVAVDIERAADPYADPRCVRVKERECLQVRGEPTSVSRDSHGTLLLHVGTTDLQTSFPARGYPLLAATARPPSHKRLRYHRM